MNLMPLTMTRQNNPIGKRALMQVDQTITEESSASHGSPEMFSSAGAYNDRS